MPKKALASSPVPFRPPVWPVVLLLAGLVAAGVLLLVRPPTPPRIRTLPKFTLVERGGRPVTLADFKGRLVIANFIYAGCTLECRALSSKMADLQTRFAHDPDVLLVSFSVDPDADTPDALATFAANYDADPRRWIFLTGDRPAVFAFLREAFPEAVTFGPGGEADGIVLRDHCEKFALLDPTSTLRGYYPASDLNFADQIARALAVIRKEKL